jgi:hypothetical protein
MRTDSPNNSPQPERRPHSGFGRVSAAIALTLGAVSVVMSAVSAVLFVTLGSKCGHLLNRFLDWHGGLSFSALAFVIFAMRSRRERFAILGLILCFVAWFVTAAFEANTYGGNR